MKIEHLKDCAGSDLLQAGDLVRAAGFPVTARDAVVAELTGKRRIGDNGLRAWREAEARVDGTEEADGTGADGGGEMERAGVDADHEGAAPQEAGTFMKGKLAKGLQGAGDGEIFAAVEKMAATADLEDGEVGCADEAGHEALPMGEWPFADGGAGSGVDGDEAAPGARAAEPFGKFGIAHGLDGDVRGGAGRKRNADAGGHFFHEATLRSGGVVFVEVTEATGIEPPRGEGSEGVAMKNRHDAVDAGDEPGDGAKLRARAENDAALRMLGAQDGDAGLGGEHVAKTTGTKHDEQRASAAKSDATEPHGLGRDVKRYGEASDEGVAEQLCFQASLGLGSRHGDEGRGYWAAAILARSMRISSSVRKMSAGSVRSCLRPSMTVRGMVPTRSPTKAW